VDSSIGGKVAVNLPRGKNLVGSFYQPKGVFIDPLVLRTLKDRVFNDGLGEVIKYGVIEDEELFYSLMDYENKEALLKGLDEIIYRCCNIKVKIVEADEMDMGDRMLLNFGHTIGHAIEKYFKFKKFSHGEAVAMGMYAITRLGEEMSNTKAGTSESIKNILIKYDLPWQLPEMNSEELLKTIQYDKKNISGAMNIVLIEAIGKGFIMKFEQEKLKDYFKKCLKLKI
jgi:3-dehydroquinate synthase